MSDIRFNRWLHQSGTGGIYQDASGRAGIGTDSPAVALDVRNSSPILRLYDTDATNAYTNITNLNGNMYLGARDDSSNGVLLFGGYGGGTFTEYFRSSSTTFTIDTNQQERMRINSTGNVGIGTDSPAEKLSVAGNVRVQNSADAAQYLNLTYQGIDFQNTGAGSSTTSSAHLLDDYEEGTWTPEVAGSTTVGTATYANQFGSYEKIGRQVTVRGFIDYTSATGTGSVRIIGLPFISTSTSFDYIQSGSIMVHTLTWPAGRTMVSSYIANGTSTISPFASGSGTSYTTIAMAATGRFIFSITYSTP